MDDPGAIKAERLTGWLTPTRNAGAKRSFGRRCRHEVAQAGAPRGRVSNHRTAGRQEETLTPEREADLLLHLRRGRNSGRNAAGVSSACAANWNRLAI